MQCFLNDEWGKITPKDMCQASCQHTRKQNQETEWLGFSGI